MDREKVIKGLECCVCGDTSACERCGYIDDGCLDNPYIFKTAIMCDALELLKAQNEIIDDLRCKPLTVKDLPDVVRCCECKYGKSIQDADAHEYIQCTNREYPAANIETWPLELDWFCAGGERR